MSIDEQTQQQQVNPQQPVYNQPQFDSPNVVPPTPKKKGLFKRKSTWIFLSVIMVLLIVIVSMSKGTNTSSTGTTQSTDTSVNQTDTAQNSDTSSTQPTAAPTKAPVWTTTHTYTGNGTKKTEVFHVGDDWKITWSCDPSSSYGGQYNVAVIVYNSDGTIADPGAVNTICKAGNIGDVTEEHQGGDVYLNVISEGSWTIKTQELK